MTIRRRTFPEVLDNILTSLTQGVSAEAHPFPPPDADAPPYSHSLIEGPASDIVSVYGSRFTRTHLFVKDSDYALSDDGASLDWLEGDATPDEGTVFNVNYRKASGVSDRTDIFTGSVVRTLAESISLEIAGLYAQLEAVYQSGFIDTAGGSSLDKVVALLGIQRVEGGKATGDIEFTRASSTQGAISIPSGTRVMTADGSVEYETTASVTLAPGQNVARVVARDLETNDPLDADTLIVLPVPIAGVASVTNPAPTTISSEDETDPELRLRAKNFLYGSERATPGALVNAIKKQGVSAEVTEDPVIPGFVTITPHAESIPADLEQRLLTAIDETRPAGVLVTLDKAQPPRKVTLELVLTTAAGMLEQDLRAAQQDVRDGIEDYFTRLPAGDNGSLNKIVGIVLAVNGVEDVRIVSATWDADGTQEDVLDRDAGILAISGYPTVLDELQIADPNLPTILSVVVTHPSAETPANGTLIQTNLTDALTYLNSINASEPEGTAADDPRRTVSFGKLLHAITLPGKPAASLSDFDDAVEEGTPPALPDETTILPYVVEVFITMESGLSRILSTSADSYLLTPFERLSLSAVEVQAED